MLPPKDGWVLVGCLNAGGVVVLPNKPPVVEPVGLELKSDEVLLLPKTGAAPLPKLVVVMGLPNADWANGLFCVAVLNPPKKNGCFNKIFFNEISKMISMYQIYILNDVFPVCPNIFSVKLWQNLA